MQAVGLLCLQPSKSSDSLVVVRFVVFFSPSSFSMSSISRGQMKKVCQLKWDFSLVLSNTSRFLGIARDSCPYPHRNCSKKTEGPQCPQAGARRCAGLWDLDEGCCHRKEPFPAPAERFCHSSGCSILTGAIPVKILGCWTLWRSGVRRQLQESPLTL